MTLGNGFISRILQAIIFLLLYLFPQTLSGQEGILDSIFTFSKAKVSTGAALEIITGRTGYNFTYDSRLIDKDKVTLLNFKNIKLSSALDSLFHDNTLTYSVIDKFIIISRDQKKNTPFIDSIPRQETRYITGIIIDEETSEPLPFATVGLRNKGIGTVTNNNGQFGLKITPDLSHDTLVISYLGYVRTEKPVAMVTEDNLAIQMRREYISIPEIIIRNQIPQEIINKTVLSIKQNYSREPAYLTGFYREGVMKKRELQNYSEAVVNIFKTAYSGSIQGDQMKIYKSRKIDNIRKADTLAVRLKAGLNTCLQLDGARNLFDFLNHDNIPDYRYRLADIVTWEDESAFQIEFEQREDIDQPLYKGVVYINTYDYAILHADFELNPAFLHNLKTSFIASTTRGFNTWPVSVKYSVSYRKINGIYFLSHVRGDLQFTSKKKKKLFSSQFNVFFEIAITDVDLRNVRRFEKEELAPVHSVFSKTINSYDPEFWGNQNFLRPEDNLLKALTNMKVKLQEFTDE